MLNIIYLVKSFFFFFICIYYYFHFSGGYNFKSLALIKYYLKLNLLYILVQTKIESFVFRKRSNSLKEICYLSIFKSWKVSIIIFLCFIHTVLLIMIILILLYYFGILLLFYNFNYHFSPLLYKYSVLQAI